MAQITNFGKMIVNIIFLDLMINKTAYEHEKINNF